MGSQAKDIASVFSVDDVALALGVSAPTVRTFVASGELVATCVSRSPNSRKPRYRITTDALAAFLRHRSRSAPLPATGHARASSSRRRSVEPASYHKFYEE